MFHAKRAGGQAQPDTACRAGLVPHTEIYMGAVETTADMQIKATTVIATTILDSYPGIRAVIPSLGTLAVMLGAFT